MGFGERLGDLTLKFAKFVAVGAVVTSGGGLLKEGMAKETLHDIEQGRLTGNMVESAKTKQEEAVQEIKDASVLSKYGNNLFGKAFGLGFIGAMIVAGTKKKEGEQPDSSRKDSPAPIA